MLSGTETALIILIVLTLLFLLYQNRHLYMSQGFNLPQNPYNRINQQIEAARGAKIHSSELPRSSVASMPRDNKTNDTITRKSLMPSKYQPANKAEAQLQRGFWESNTSQHARAALPSDMIDDLYGVDVQNYNEQIAQKVLDPRSFQNHKEWVAGLGPHDMTSRVLDTMDEAMEASTNFIGLRRPQPVAQYNPLQLTELGSNTFEGNRKFNFLG